MTPVSAKTINAWLVATGIHGLSRERQKRLKTKHLGEKKKVRKSKNSCSPIGHLFINCWSKYKMGNLLNRKNAETYAFAFFHCS